MVRQISLLIAFLMATTAWADWQQVEAVRAAVGNTSPSTQGIIIDLPLVSEDGSAVPLTVSVDSAMAADSFIESIQIFATGNPNPEVVDFYLTPRVGKAEVSTRIRINESQTIWAVARSNTGAVWVAQKDVRVTVGGCLSRSNDNATVRLSQARVAVPKSFDVAKPAEVRTLVTHPMETGLREGPDGNLLPRRLVDTFEVIVDGEVAIQVRLHSAVSANPYLRFFLSPQQSAAAEFRWQEDTGDTLRETVDLRVN